jgi:TPR repeat protein
MNEPAPRPVDVNPAPPPAPVQSSPAQAAPPSVAKPEIALDQNEIDTLIRRGKNLLNDGDFAAARVLFERAGNAGSAEAALALGSTYDPNVIKRLGAIMVRPDVEKARQWYQLAADRGSAAAASLQLANLPQSR